LRLLKLFCQQAIVGRILEFSVTKRKKEMLIIVLVAQPRRAGPELKRKSPAQTVVLLESASTRGLSHS
jgi:hypothetical protein